MKWPYQSSWRAQKRGFVSPCTWDHRLSVGVKLQNCRQSHPQRRNCIGETGLKNASPHIRDTLGTFSTFLYLLYRSLAFFLLEVLHACPHRLGSPDLSLYARLDLPSCCLKLPAPLNPHKGSKQQTKGSTASWISSKQKNKRVIIYSAFHEEGLRLEI